MTGQEIAEQELGGSKIHCEVSGVGDGEFDDDAACLAAVRRSTCRSSRRTATSRRPTRRATTRSTAATSRCSTCSPSRRASRTTCTSCIRSVVDHGDIFDIKPRFARSIITCFARIGGKSVGIVANQPMHLGGILDNDSADKAAHFIQICDAFNVPLVFLQDVPGFMVGSKVEHAGIIRHGAKMLHVMSAATVPKLTVVVRKAYGAGYYVMCGRAYEPDLIVSWPTGGDQRDGRRGHGRHRGEEALRGRASRRPRCGRASST